MKNKLIFILSIYFLIINHSYSESIKFETEKIEILKNQDTIIASNGKAVSLSRGLEIYADNFKYLKKNKLLIIEGNGQALINSNRVKINFDNAIYDENLNLIEFKNEIEVIHLNKNFSINSSSIIYNINDETVKSNFNTTIKDNFLNNYSVSSFLYEIKNNLLKLKNLKLVDVTQNIIQTELAFINTNTGNLFGKDINIRLHKSAQNDNEPRIKGNSLINNDDITEITKGVFTNCKSREGCPPWQLSSRKIIHNKKEKTIYYNDAVLKVYNVPIAYFPRFFHPDPTVKRKSGFLTPSIKTSKNLGDYLNTPYFFAISENKDMTFIPRFYDSDKLLFQTEFRQQNKLSNHIVDFSLFNDSKKKSKNHFFYDLNKKLDLSNMNNSELKIKIQHASNDTYLKAEKLQSEIEFDDNVLKNSLDLNLIRENTSININSTIYENLNLNNNDKYEFIFADINLYKKIDQNLNQNGNLSFTSNILSRQHSTNNFTNLNYNELRFSSLSKIYGIGFSNNYEILLKNLNSKNKNTTYKNKSSQYLSGIFQYNSSIPLIKANEKNQKTIIPKISLKLAPDHTKNDPNNSEKMDLANLYSINRLSGKDTTEGGASLSYGNEYSIIDKSESRETFNLQLANNLRLKKNEDLPHRNQLDEKTSNIFTKIKFHPNNFLMTEYGVSLNSNLKEIDNENLITKFKFKNFTSSFDYLNENYSSVNQSYLENKSTYQINNNNSFIFSTRENKTKDIKEYYNLMYQYKNDCLSASIEYNKDYYDDSDIKPNEGILFKLTIIPFGETSSPNLIK